MCQTPGRSGGPPPESIFELFVASDSIAFRVKSQMKQFKLCGLGFSVSFRVYRFMVLNRQPILCSVGTGCFLTRSPFAPEYLYIDLLQHTPKPYSNAFGVLS